MTTFSNFVSEPLWYGVLIPLLQVDYHANVDFRTWLDINTRISNHDHRNNLANIQFITIMWSLWKARNRYEFDNMLIEKDEVLRESNNYANSILHAFKQDMKTPNNADGMLIRWIFPPVGKVKLNTDGSCLGNPRPAGFGGVTRDDKGNWLEGFAGFIGKATILKAELWAVREAMILIKKKDWMCAIVEVDSTNVMELLMNEDVDDHPLKPLIQDCKSIMKDMKLSVSHTLREGNRCADAMAKLGVNQLEKLEVFHHVPSMVKGILEADARGICFPRGF